MTAALDMTTGKAGIAYVGEVPWHGQGQMMIPGLPIDVWRKQAGLDWRCLRAGVQFDRDDGTKGVSTKHNVLYRSDSGAVLSVMSAKYQPVQPAEILDFYQDLTAKHGFQLETAGSLKGGRRIWALARCPERFELPGRDVSNLYLLLATSFDGTASTQCRWTAIRVVCNNKFGLAIVGAADVSVPHHTVFNADEVKLSMQIGDAWANYGAMAAAFAKRPVTQKEVTSFLLQVYLDLVTDDDVRAKREKDGEKLDKQIEKLTERFQRALFNSPGAHTEAARGTLWGVVNAVTHDADFLKPARNQGNRLESAWFGDGAQLKAKAFDLARTMV
jgi:phage/plasmid-like protein (TIGR03299 family)